MYRFYSRRKGWETGENNMNFYHSSIFYPDINLDSFIDKTGYELYQNLENKSTILSKMCLIYKDWYLYKYNEKMGSYNTI